MNNRPLHIFIIPIVLLAMAIAWRIVTLGLADFYTARGETESALAWRPSHFGALEAAAMQVFQANPAQAREWLTRALAANPVRGVNYARLGVLWGLEGQTDKAAIAMAMAVRLAPAQVATRLIAAAFALEHGDVAGALQSWSVVMTQRPALRPSLYPVLLRIAEHPDHREALKTLVNSAELPWWPSFVVYAINSKESLEVVMHLFQLSQTSADNSLSGQTFNAVLKRLQGEGLWLNARLAWMDSLKDEQLQVMGNLFNGSFEQPISDIGFDWIRQPAGYILVERALTNAVDGRYALSVHFRGPRVQYRHLSQTIMLPPGRYNLRGHVRPEDFQAEYGLQWTISCSGAQKRQIGQTESFLGSSAWRSFTVPFTVPATDCPAQVVRLHLDGRVALDFDARGTVWFDAMTVKPSTVPSP